jgi:hypothetical protein
MTRVSNASQAEDGRQKILAHDDYVQGKLDQLEGLIGKSSMAGNLRGSYLKMLLNSNTELVKHREIDSKVALHPR